MAESKPVSDAEQAQNFVDSLGGFSPFLQARLVHLFDKNPKLTQDFVGTISELSEDLQIKLIDFFDRDTKPEASNPVSAAEKRAQEAYDNDQRRLDEEHQAKLAAIKAQEDYYKSRITPTRPLSAQEERLQRVELALYGMTNAPTAATEAGTIAGSPPAEATPSAASLTPPAEVGDTAPPPADGTKESGAEAPDDKPKMSAETRALEEILDQKRYRYVEMLKDMQNGLPTDDETEHMREVYEEALQNYANACAEEHVNYLKKDKKEKRLAFRDRREAKKTEVIQYILADELKKQSEIAAQLASEDSEGRSRHERLRDWFGRHRLIRAVVRRAISGNNDEMETSIRGYQLESMGFENSTDAFARAQAKDLGLRTDAAIRPNTEELVANIDEEMGNTIEELRINGASEEDIRYSLFRMQSTSLTDSIEPANIERSDTSRLRRLIGDAVLSSYEHRSDRVTGLREFDSGENFLNMVEDELFSQGSEVNVKTIDTYVKRLRELNPINRFLELNPGHTQEEYQRLFVFGSIVRNEQILPFKIKIIMDNKYNLTPPVNNANNPPAQPAEAN